MDASLSDFDMSECINGHTFCNAHQKRGLDDLTKEELLVEIDAAYPTDGEYPEDRAELLEALEADDRETIYERMEWNYGYQVPERVCPICAMDVISDGDMKSFLKKQTGITEAEVFAEVKKVNGRRRKLYDSEYNAYALKKLSNTRAEVEESIVKQFDHDYEAFYNYISG